MTSQEVCTNLNHCLSVMSQQDEVRRLQLEEETEKRRVLEDALHVLAQEHHALEKSVHIKAKQRGVSLEFLILPNLCMQIRGFVVGQLSIYSQKRLFPVHNCNGYA